MKRLQWRLTGLIAVLLLVTGSGFAQPRIDQEQVNVDEATGGLAIGGASDQKLAQGFTAGADGFLTHVTIPVGCDPFAQLVVSIHDVVGGMPGTTILTSEALDGALFPFTPPSPDAAFRIIMLSRPVRVTAGVSYAIVLEELVPGAECGILSAPGGDSYTGGSAYFDARPNPPGWVPLALAPNDPDDLPFQVYLDKSRGTPCRPFRGK